MSFFAEVNISVGSGKSLRNSDSEHIDFWMFDHFDAVKAVTKVAPV